MSNTRAVCNFEHFLVVEQIRLDWHESGRSLADVGLPPRMAKVKNPPTPSALSLGLRNPQPRDYINYIVQRSGPPPEWFDIKAFGSTTVVANLESCLDQEHSS